MKDETPGGMSKVVTLTSALFEDSEGQAFELSFAVPWDDEHRFDVTFEDGRLYGSTISLSDTASSRCRPSNERKVVAPSSRAAATWRMSRAP